MGSVLVLGAAGPDGLGRDGAGPVKADALTMLRRAGMLSRGRDVTEARIVCDLVIGGRRYPVIDLVETVHGIDPPRGVRRAVILTPTGMKANELPYFHPAAPASCHGDVLTFSDAVEVGNFLPEGRRVSVENGAADMWVVDGS